MKKLLISLFLFCSMLLMPQSTQATYWSSFSIVEYLGYGEILITDGTYYYQIDYNYFDCSFDSLDEGNTLYIDTYFSPSYGDDLYYEDDYGNSYLCSVSNFPDSITFDSYTILYSLGYDGLLVSDGSYEYIVDTSYDCSFSYSDEGDVIYIDSVVYPSYGDYVYAPDSYGDFCTVSNFPDQLDLYTLNVTEVDYDTITVDLGSTTYLVDYGTGCYSTYFTYADLVAVDSYDNYLSTSDDLHTISSTYGHSSCSISSITELPDTSDDPPATDDNSDSTDDASTVTDEISTATVEKPNKPSELTTTSVKKRRATATWNEEANTSYYKLQLKKGNKTIKKFSNVSSSKKKIGKKYLKSNKKYKCRVKACNSAGCSKWTQYKKFQTN